MGNEEDEEGNTSDYSAERKDKRAVDEKARSSGSQSEDKESSSSDSSDESKDSVAEAVVVAKPITEAVAAKSTAAAALTVAAPRSDVMMRHPRPQGKVGAKMLVRSGLRCVCHFAISCPYSRGQ